MDGSHCVPLQFSFDVGFLAIFGQLDDTYRERLKENYCIVDKGYNSFPTKIPGTAYHKALLVSNSHSFSKNNICNHTERL